MEKLLVVSGSQRGIDVLCDLLNKSGHTNIDFAISSCQAKEKLLNVFYDIVIINLPLEDTSGIELSIFAAENFDSGVIVIVKDEFADAVQEKTEDLGVYILTKPLTLPLFNQAIRFVGSAQKRMYMLKKENTKLVKKVEDIKIIDRAKCCLMEYLKIPEAAAHRHLEKQAMDMRLPKREIAESILKTYES